MPKLHALENTVRQLQAQNKKLKTSNRQLQEKLHASEDVRKALQEQAAFFQPLQEKLQVSEDGRTKFQEQIRNYEKDLAELLEENGTLEWERNNFQRDAEKLKNQNDTQANKIKAAEARITFLTDATEKMLDEHDIAVSLAIGLRWRALSPYERTQRLKIRYEHLIANPARTRSVAVQTQTFTRNKCVNTETTAQISAAVQTVSVALNHACVGTEAVPSSSTAVQTSSAPRADKCITTEGSQTSSALSASKQLVVKNVNCESSQSNNSNTRPRRVNITKSHIPPKKLSKTNSTSVACYQTRPSSNHTRRRSPRCKFRCASAHATSRCPTFNALAMDEVPFIAALIKHNPAFCNSLVSSTDRSLHSFYQSIKQRAEAHLKFRSRRPICHVCQCEGDHWSSACPIGNLQNVSMREWFEMFRTKNEKMFVKLYDSNALVQFYSKLVRFTFPSLRIV